MEKKQYQVKLYYGYEDSESGVYHSFEAVDPDALIDEDEMAAQLAELLDRDVDDEDFDYSSMYIRLPDAVVERIKSDGVKEYLEAHNK